jgi:hypothetical protein
MKPRLDSAPLTDEDCEIWLFVVSRAHGHIGDRLADSRQTDKLDACRMLDARRIRLLQKPWGGNFLSYPIHDKEDNQFGGRWQS